MCLVSKHSAPRHVVPEMVLRVLEESEAVSDISSLPASSIMCHVMCLRTIMYHVR